MTAPSSTIAPVSAPRAKAKTRGSDYSQLMTRVRDAGLLERRTGYYVLKMVINAALMIGGWVAFVLIGQSWWQLAVAAYLAIVFTQSGFLGHEAGHRQLFRTRSANEIAGLIHGNLAIGLAFGWWVDKHHRHHANPNQENLDPDIGGDALVFTESQALRRSGIGRLVARHQSKLFFPMLLLEGLALHVASVKSLLQGAQRNRGREAVLLIVHAAAYLTIIFLVLPPLPALGFIAVQQGLFGLYLGSSFAPNHKGMPILAEDDNTDFLRRQVLTSRNVRGNWLIDWMLGGLNYQIEHHLFPSMPRSALKHARPIVREFCAEHQISYAETGLFDSYRQALTHLDTVGKTEPVTA
jgi:fatty acid desaturase